MLATTTDPSKPILCTTLPRYYNEVQEYDNCTSVKVGKALFLILFVFNGLI